MNQLLTDEEIREISIDCLSVSPSDIYFARVIEAKILKALNSAEPIYQLRPDWENWIDCTEKFYGEWRGDKRMLFTHPPAPSAVEGWTLVPTDILDAFPEINPSNYDHDDACRLNAWGVELVLAAARSEE